MPGQKIQPPCNKQPSAVSAAISVVMPVYNGTPYLREAIDSILGQTRRDFEFILVDDGSTDGSLDIMREYKRRYDCIRLISRPNTGIAGALNDGIEIADAPIVFRMDADDIALPERLERQMAYLDDHPDCVAVGCRVELIDEGGAPICVWGEEEAHEQIVDGYLNLRGQMILHPAAAMRRDAVMEIGGYRTEYEGLEDMDLFLRLATIGRLANLPDMLMRYRQHLDSYCYREPEQQNQRREALLREAGALLAREVPVSSLAFSRPPVTRATAHRSWGWWALRAGNVTTARKHAVAAVARSPWSLEAWKLLLCSLRGH